jgi:hypothetical protein
MPAIYIQEHGLHVLFFFPFFFFNGHDNIEMPFDKEVEMENASVFS